MLYASLYSKWSSQLKNTWILQFYRYWYLQNLYIFLRIKTSTNLIMILIEMIKSKKRIFYGSSFLKLLVTVEKYICTKINILLCIQTKKINIFYKNYYQRCSVVVKCQLRVQKSRVLIFPRPIHTKDFTKWK